MMHIVNNAVVSSEIGRSLFGNASGRKSIFSGPKDRSDRLRSASILFSSEGVGRVLIRALPTGLYSGSKGNSISAVMFRMSANRFAFQMFTRDGSQINGNVVATGGMAAAVTKFNDDADLNSDFEAIALTADVDHVFSTGTGYSGSTLLTGGDD